MLQATPHDVTWHVVFNAFHVAMHISWQLVHRTDPGTIGLEPKGVSTRGFAVRPIPPLVGWSANQLGVACRYINRRTPRRSMRCARRAKPRGAARETAGSATPAAWCGRCARSTRPRSGSISVCRASITTALGWETPYVAAPSADPGFLSLHGVWRRWATSTTRISCCTPSAPVPPSPPAVASSDPMSGASCAALSPTRWCANPHLVARSAP